jgi:hypothetical protein
MYVRTDGIAPPVDSYICGPSGSIVRRDIVVLGATAKEVFLTFGLATRLEAVCSKALPVNIKLSPFYLIRGLYMGDRPSDTCEKAQDAFLALSIYTRCIRASCARSFDQASGFLQINILLRDIWEHVVTMLTG